jgi:hypothetical protein
VVLAISAITTYKLTPNQASQAWVEPDYNRKLHSEIGQTPLDRFSLAPR